MRVRHAIAPVAAALLLAACGADAVTGPEARTPADRPAYLGVGWAGGNGAVPPDMPTSDSESQR